MKEFTEKVGKTTYKLKVTDKAHTYVKITRFNSDEEKSIFVPVNLLLDFFDFTYIKPKIEELINQSFSNFRSGE